MLLASWHGWTLRLRRCTARAAWYVAIGVACGVLSIEAVMAQELAPAAVDPASAIAAHFFEHYLQAFLSSAAAALVAYGAMRVKVDRLEKDVASLWAKKADMGEVSHTRELAAANTTHLADSLDLIRDEMTSIRKDLHHELELIRRGLVPGRSHDDA